MQRGWRTRQVLAVVAAAFISFSTEVGSEEVSLVSRMVDGNPEAALVPTDGNAPTATLAPPSGGQALQGSDPTLVRARVPGACRKTVHTVAPLPACAWGWGDPCRMLGL